jgi:RNA polymerase sigma-70 factor, ECF subfamily
MTLSSTDHLLDRARSGDMDAVGSLLQRYQTFLLLLAKRRLSGRLQARVDAADLVQQTLLEAQRDLPAFRGSTEEELVVWLKQILHHNVQQSIQRHWEAKKRSLQQECSLDQPWNDGIALRDCVAADQTSPSQRAMRGEAAVRLATAIGALPDDQQEAVRLRHLEGYSLKQLAEVMGRSETAVAGLLKRGLKRLRDQLLADGTGSAPA